MFSVAALGIVIVVDAVVEWVLRRRIARTPSTTAITSQTEIGVTPWK
jgi:hypothetical protein